MLVCPWCECSFSKDDQIRFMEQASSVLLMGKVGPPLVRIDGKVFEMQGHCRGCAAPMASEPKGKPFHVDVRSSVIQAVNN